MDKSEIERVVSEYRKQGSQRKTADALGMTRGSVQRRLEAAEAHGIEWRAPVEVPKGYTSYKTTVQYNGAGEVIQEWRRLSPDQEALEEFTNKLCEKVVGKASPSSSAPVSDSDKMLEVVVSDAHLGMMSWHKETGRDYDIHIGTKAALAAVDFITAGRSAAVGVLVFNGDNVHTDNRSAVTEASGNTLDTDSRYHKMLDHAVTVVTESVEKMHKCCTIVRLIIVPGNHDWHTSVCLSRVLDAYYRDDKRVDVVTTPRPRKITMWGDVMLCHAHGDRVKPKDWQGVISTEYPQQWGRTKHRFAHLGHIHHSRGMQPFLVDEQKGIHVEYLRSLCPPDAWHVDSGFVGSTNGAEGFVYHKEHGLIERIYWNISQLKG